jgi:hypothetical protein
VRATLDLVVGEALKALHSEEVRRGNPHELSRACKLVVSAWRGHPISREKPKCILTRVRWPCQEIKSPAVRGALAASLLNRFLATGELTVTPQPRDHCLIPFR